MKSIGIIGGIGPDSTIDYYRLILAGFRERTSSVASPSIIINSIDMNKMLRYIETGELDSAATYLAFETERLANAGVDYALLAANTPHFVFHSVQRQTSVPLISIVEAVRDAAKALNVKHLGLIGTKFTMEGSFYPDVFLPNGFELSRANAR